MRKKFFAMYALVGALVASPVFTSCVDDSESASVTAIRNAKAEQLKAQAAYDLARTEYEKALTAYKEAELAAKLAETEQDKALFEYQLATAKALYEKTAVEYEKEKLYYLQTMANTENQMISNAASKYTGALDQLNTLNKNLVQAKGELAIIGIDSAKNVALFNEYIATQNKTIAEATAKIERIKAYKGDSKEALYQKMQTVVSNFQNLNVEWSAANDAKTAANTAYTDASTAYDNTAASKLEYVKAINDLKASPYFFTITSENDSYDVYNGTTLTSTQYTKSYSAVLESQVLAYTQSLNAALKTAKDNLGAAKTDAAAATGGYAVLEALETALKTAKDGLAATPATHTQAQVDAAELLLAQYKDDATSTTDWDNATAGLQPGFAYLQNAVKAAEKNIADFEALIAAVTEGSDEHKEWVAAQEALLAAAEAYNEAYDKEAELAKAKDATGILSVTINTNGEEQVTPTSPTGEYQTLKALYNGISDANSMIAALEADIAEAKANIEKGMSSTYTETVAIVERYWDPVAGDWIYYNSTTQIATHIYGVDTEDLKALAEDKIAAIEAKIEVQETLVAKYKAELDALLTAEA